MKATTSAVLIARDGGGGGGGGGGKKEKKQAKPTFHGDGNGQCNDTGVAVLSLHVACVAIGKTCDVLRDRTPATAALVDCEGRVVRSWVIRVPEEDVVSYLTPMTGVAEGDLNAHDAVALSTAKEQLRIALRERGGADRVVFVGQNPRFSLDWMGLVEGTHYKKIIDLAVQFRSERTTFGLEHLAKVLLDWKPPRTVKQGKKKKKKKKEPSSVRSSLEAAQLSISLYNKLVELNRDPTGQKLTQCKAKLVSTTASHGVARQLGYNAAAWNGVCVRSSRRCFSCGSTVAEQIATCEGALEDKRKEIEQRKERKQLKHTHHTQMLERLGPMVVDLRNRRGTPLHEAAATNNFQLSEWLIDAKADVNARREYNGHTPLHEASARGSTACVKQLIEAKAGVNVQATDDRTALHEAAARGSTECVRQLIEAKAGVNVQANDGRTALHDAAARGSTECVRQLIEAKAGVNVQATDDRTALHEAAARGSTECVRQLIEAKAGVNVQANDGRTALHEADTKTFQLLCENGANRDLKAKNGRKPSEVDAKLKSIQLQLDVAGRGLALVEAELSTQDQEHAATLARLSPIFDFQATGGRVLERAIRENDEDAVKLLLDAKANVNLSCDGRDPGTPLHVAAKAGNANIVKVLLQRKARPNAPKAYYDAATALHVAVEQGNPELMKLLLRHTADVNVDCGSTSHLRTPLHIAVAKADEQAVKLLLDSKADVNSIKWKPPLRLALEGHGRKHAVEGDRTNILRLILGAKADVNMVHGCATALEIALRRNFSCDLFKLLLDAKAYIGANDGGRTFLHKVVAEARHAENSRALVGLLLETKADANAMGSGRSPLHEAARLYNEAGPALVEMLLRAKADANCASDDGSSALQAAARAPGWATSAVAATAVALLLEAKADVNATGCGRTPLHEAASLNNEAGPALVEMLLRAKADTNVATDQGRTPLHNAASVSHEQGPLLVGMLLEAKARVNTKTDNADDALLLACAKTRHGAGVTGTVKQLLDAKARVNTKTDDGRIPLLEAAAHTPEVRAELMPLLLDAKANVNVKRDDDVTALLLATAHGEVPMVEQLLELKANVNAQTHDGRTTLDTAHRRTKLSPKARLRLITMLVAAKADVDTTDTTGVTALLVAVGDDRARYYASYHSDGSACTGSTPLLKALRFCDSAVAKLLLAANADVNATTSDGQTPLYLASDDATLQLLLDAKADANATTCDGRTCLHAQSENGNAGAVAILLAANADVNATTSDGQTPLYLASDDATLQLLLDAKADANATTCDGRTCLHDQSENDNAGAVAILLAANADVNATTSDGLTALHLASQNPAKSSQLLLDAKADVNAASDNGSTPLHLASRPFAGDTTDIEALVEAKADVNAASNDGSTPLLGVLDRRGEIPIQTMQVLLEAKADVNAARKDATPLLLVVRRVDIAAVEFLLEAKADVDAKTTSGQTALKVAKATKFKTPQKKQLLKLLNKAKAEGKSSPKKKKGKPRAKQGGGGGGSARGVDSD